MKIFLHIGTHKTGSTSLQAFIRDNTDYLKNNGICFYKGKYNPLIHNELYLAAMRPEKESFAKLTMKDVTFDDNFTKHTEEMVKDFVQNCVEPALIFSCEGLSLLRHDDEIDKLKKILDPDNNEVTVILYLRNKKDYLTSYTAQILKNPSRKLSDDPKSALYVKEDTWLTDFDKLVECYQKGFGRKNIIIIDYDKEMQNIDNIIPSFFTAINLEVPQDSNIGDYKRNKTRKIS